MKNEKIFGPGRYIKTQQRIIIFLRNLKCCTKNNIIQQCINLEKLKYQCDINILK